MKHKTKVIAFRVTEEEYQAICWAAAKDKVGVGEYVRRDFATTLGYTIEAMQTEVRKLEAKAKRAAKKTAAQPINAVLQDMGKRLGKAMADGDA